jgi:hypothetical protein
VCATFAADTTRLECRSGTRLGRPVLPLVCRISATSSGTGCWAALFPRGSTRWTAPCVSISTVSAGMPPVSCGAARLLCPMCGTHQHIRRGVSQEEKDLLVRIGGIERGGGAGDGGRQEGDDGGRAIGQNARHPPSALLRRMPSQHVRHGQHLLPQRGVGDPYPQFRYDDRCAFAGDKLQQIKQRSRRVHRAHPVSVRAVLTILLQILLSPVQQPDGKCTTREDLVGPGSWRCR